MADQTTSSTTLSPTENSSKSSLTQPDVSEVQIVSSLAKSLNESYEYVKQKQQLYKELCSGNTETYAKRRKILSSSLQNKEDQENKENGKPEQIKMSENKASEWQDVISYKNKLKRKKKLSASLTSVTDSVNQEKRTRIEGIQLNCRGKLQIKESPKGMLQVTSSQGASAKTTSSDQNKTEKDKVVAKPPLPPNQGKSSTSNTVAPPPRLKRKLLENVQTIQKLNTLTEQLRLEINELKSNLTTERGAVRVLRAQNECESRKWKNEVKKLQQQIEQMKKGVLSNSKKLLESSSSGINDSSIFSSAHGLVNYEIQRLTNEINVLKDSNKSWEEKNLINCDADRRKTADIRELRDSYENRLTQLTKSAKIEISRLLEEIKTKERNIGQLKKDLQILQNQSTTHKSPIKRGNPSTTKNLKQTTNDKPNLLLTTTNFSKQTNKKPKKTALNSSKPQDTNPKASNKQKLENKINPNNNGGSTEGPSPKDSKAAQHTNEITHLRDIELIKNTKNLNMKTSISSTNTTNGVKPLTQTQNNILQTLKNNSNNNTNNINNENHKNIINNNNNNNNLNSLLTTTVTNATKSTSTSCGSCQREYHSMPSELNEHFNTNSSTATTTPNTTDCSSKRSNDCNDLPIYRSKDSHSDSDSALSSAPPSISPQPPANGLEPNDIWQTIRSYSQDSEKLQKEVEDLQKENERLQKELNLAKEQILDFEKTAIEANKQHNSQQFLERIKYLEDQEHHLQNECSELREQNELLEFRILELEETNDKWSLQSHVPPTTSSNNNSSTSSSQVNNASHATKDLWSNNSNHSGGSSSSGNKAKLDPMQLLFGNNNNCMIDSGITSPHSQLHAEDDFHLLDITNEELCRRLASMLKKTSSLDDDDKQYLQQVITLVQQFDLLSQRTSGPASLNTSCSSSDEPSSLEMAKSRVSDYSSASSSSTSSTKNLNSCDNNKKSSSTSVTSVKPIGPPLSSSTSSASTGLIAGNVSSAQTPSSRIVATVQPYNSSSSQNHQTNLIVPTNTPNESPRKIRGLPWQCNSLSESGVFVEESDYLEVSSSSLNLNQNSEQSVCTQTDFFEEDEEDEEFTYISSKPCQQKLQRYHSSPITRLPNHQSSSAHYLNEQKHLQFYKDRLEHLESKVLIYESSGDIQAKRLADRLQREIQLEKQLKELQERVECLESENLNLEEEKCEFEEAENDTRLRLQRLEIELEILSQRNVELELSKEALSAKYKDCRSECMILREDLEACERQVKLIEEDKQRAKENFEFLHSLIPLFCCYSAIVITNLYQEEQLKHHPESLGECCFDRMGNVPSSSSISVPSMVMKTPSAANKDVCSKANEVFAHTKSVACSTCGYDPNQVHLLREEIISLRMQMNEMNTHHFAALETADNQWVDLERSYKEREESYKINEHNLKQKIAKLQDCMKEDARAANEKLQTLEESEESLKICLVRISKEHRDLFEKYKTLCDDIDHLRDENENLKSESKPTLEAYENEKRRCKELTDELSFMRRLQKETEARMKAEEESLRNELTDVKKQILHADVTNSELKEEVATLEEELLQKTKILQESEEKLRELYDELRSKEEIIEKMEYYQKLNIRSSAYSLAQELKERFDKGSDEEQAAAQARDEAWSKLQSTFSHRSGSKPSETSKSYEGILKKRVVIEEVDEDDGDEDVTTSKSSSLANKINQKHIHFDLEKPSPSRRRTSISSSFDQESEPKRTESYFNKETNGDETARRSDVPANEGDVSDLSTARNALDSAIRNFQTKSEIPKLILTDITRI